MTQALRAVLAPLVVHRLGRAPDPWAWPDWSYATDEGTFGNRYDDPLRGLSRPLRLDPAAWLLPRDARALPARSCARRRAGRDRRGSARRAPRDRSRRLGAGERSGRRVGRARLSGEFLDVGHSTSLIWLRELLAPRLLHYGIPDLDAAAIRLSVPRRFTQEIGRAVYEQSDAAGERRFAGLRYLSRVGDEFENWALFEPASVARRRSERLSPEDPELIAALEQLGLVLSPTASR